MRYIPCPSISTLRYQSFFLNRLHKISQLVLKTVDISWQSILVKTKCQMTKKLSYTKRLVRRLRLNSYVSVTIFVQLRLNLWYKSVTKNKDFVAKRPHLFSVNLKLEKVMLHSYAF